MADIKNLAFKTEQLEEEKKSKTNGFPVNPVDNEDEVDALKTATTGEVSTKATEVATLLNTEGEEVAINHPEVVMNHQEEATLEQAGVAQTIKVKRHTQHKPKEGVTLDEKKPAQPLEAKIQANGVQTAKKPTHNTAQCWTKKKINPVEEEERQQPQAQQNQNNDKDPEFEDAIHSFYLAKN